MTKLYCYHKEMQNKTFSIDDYKRVVKALMAFVTDVEENHPEICKESMKNLTFELHEVCFGPHFTDDMAQEAVKDMENQDSSNPRGEYWTIEQTTDVARERGIRFDNFNAADFYYMMNMWRSDHFNSTKGDIDLIVEQVLEKLNDKDGIKGFAWHYLEMLNEHED